MLRSFVLILALDGADVTVPRPDARSWSMQTPQLALTGRRSTRSSGEKPLHVNPEEVPLSRGYTARLAKQQAEEQACAASATTPASDCRGLSSIYRECVWDDVVAARSDEAEQCLDVLLQTPSPAGLPDSDFVAALLLSNAFDPTSASFEDADLQLVCSLLPQAALCFVLSGVCCRQFVRRCVHCAGCISAE